MAVQHLDIILKGDIQNIGFTFQTMKAADEFHISGNARYLDDEKLKIEAEGEEQDLHEFIQWCKNGVPEAGSVTVDIKQSPTKNYQSFTIANITKLKTNHK